MSINSMTGYGEGIVSKSGITIQTEISSVNKKQLDIQFFLPKNLICFESDVQKQIKKVKNHNPRPCRLRTGAVVIPAATAPVKLHAKFNMLAVSHISY